VSPEKRKKGYSRTSKGERVPVPIRGRELVARKKKEKAYQKKELYAEKKI